MKRTYQPHNVRRLRTHGFRARMATAGGRQVLNRRRARGRKRVSVQCPNFRKREPMPRFGLGRERRLRKTGDYQELQKRGRRLHSTHFNLVYLPRKSGGPRLGLMVSKKVGKAHDRNRVKRWVREFFRLRQHELREGLDASLLTDEEWGIDLAVAAKPGAAELDHVEAERELAKLFKRLVAETKKRDETRVTEK